MRFRVLFVSLSIVAATTLPIVAFASIGPDAAPAPSGLTAPASTAGANVTAKDKLARTCILKLFQDQTAKQKAGKNSGGLTSGLKDNCTDETVTEDAQGKRTYTQTGREGGKNDVTKPNQCIVDSCSKPTCGTIMLAFKVPGLATPSPISKCDPQAQKMIDAFSTPQGQKDFQLNAVNQQAIQDVINSGDATKTQGLLQSFGLPQADAQQLAQNHPQDANALLTALASGDSSQIAAAKQQVQADGITLNSDLQDITTLTPQQLSQNLSDKSLLSSDQQSTINNINNSPSTFAPTDPTTTQTALRGGQYADMFHQIETQNNLPAGYLSSVCTVESACNPNRCATGLSSACGMFQYTTGTWAVDSQRYNLAVNGINKPLDPNSRFDPTIAAQVTGYTAGYYQNADASTIQNAVSAGMDPSVALYSIHNLGSAGGPTLMNAYAQDPNQSVNQVLTATEIRNNPSLYGDGTISVAQAQNNIIARMNGTATFNSPTQTASIQSPLNIGLGGGGATQDTSYTTNGQSPFAGVSLIPANSYPTTAPQGVGQLTPVSYPQGTSSGGNTSSTGNTTASNSTNNTPTGQTGAAVAQIIAQPATVFKGSSVSVSWSSAGVGTANSCSVYEASSTVIAQGNEGTQQIPLATSGVVSFTLKCTVASTGQQISSSASVTVK